MTQSLQLDQSMPEKTWALTTSKNPDEMIEWPWRRPTSLPHYGTGKLRLARFIQ
jgi:hypothetical protein